MDKFTRLLNLVGLLQQSPRALTFAEIRSQLRDEAYPQRDPESARRAFERDKADLLAMGMPLQTTKPPEDPTGTTYSIEHRSTRLTDPGFTTEELGALHFAASAMSLLTDDDTSLGDASDGLRKYGGLAGRRGRRDTAELRLDDNLTAVFAAILERSAVGFTHGGRTRMVVPRQLASRAGRWYLRGYDLDAGADRAYRLDRVEGAVLPLTDDVLAEHTVPSEPEDGSLRFRPWEFGTGEARRAEVRLDAAAAAVALAGDPGLQVLHADDEHTVVGLDVRSPEGLWPWLLSFLERAELLSPPELRDGFRSHLERLGSPATTTRGS